jgi:hypothetical protein
MLVTLGFLALLQSQQASTEPREYGYCAQPFTIEFGNPTKLSDVVQLSSTRALVTDNKRVWLIRHLRLGRIICQA